MIPLQRTSPMRWSRPTQLIEWDHCHLTYNINHLLRLQHISQIYVPGTDNIFRAYIPPLDCPLNLVVPRTTTSTYSIVANFGGPPCTGAEYNGSSGVRLVPSSLTASCCFLRLLIFFLNTFKRYLANLLSPITETIVASSALFISCCLTISLLWASTVLDHSNSWNEQQYKNAWELDTKVKGKG